MFLCLYVFGSSNLIEWFTVFSSVCPDGYLKIYLKGQEATDSYDKFDHELCGNWTTANVVSDGPRLVMVFSSGELQGSGFKAELVFHIILPMFQPHIGYVHLLHQWEVKKVYANIHIRIKAVLLISVCIGINLKPNIGYLEPRLRMEHVRLRIAALPAKEGSSTLRATPATILAIQTAPIHFMSHLTNKLL